MNRLIAAGVAVVVLVYLLFSSIYVVNVREQAIVLRFGQITEVRNEPGLYFKLPTNFIDTVQIIENRLLRYDIANMQLQVSDGAKYIGDDGKVALDTLHLPFSYDPPTDPPTDEETP